VRLKRGGGAPHASFDELSHSSHTRVAPEDLLSVNEALDRLSALSPRQSDVVECRFFAGLSVQETADALNLSPATVKRDWRAARAFLAISI
jgi:RNA polymerase sigma factor (sigma-70 family)